MTAYIGCLDPTCRAEVCVSCLSCHRSGCAKHVGRYLIGGVAYVDLCAACAAEWQRRFAQAMPAPPTMSMQVPA